MNTTLFADPTTALLLARLHQDDVRRSFPRKPRRLLAGALTSRRTSAHQAPPLRAGVTSVPVLPTALESTAVESPAVVVPSPRSADDTRIAS